MKTAITTTFSFVQTCKKKSFNDTEAECRTKHTKNKYGFPISKDRALKLKQNADGHIALNPK